MMKGRPLQVECYAGGRADERPRRVIVDGRNYVIVRLLGSSVEETNLSNERIHRYRVLTEEGLTLDIARAGEGDWYLVNEWRIARP